MTGVALTGETSPSPSVWHLPDGATTAHGGRE